MNNSDISFVIPVYNRPDEIDELLQSFTNLDGEKSFEIVIVEDGSTLSSEAIVEKYNDKLNISYFQKPNSGPGDSRNFGMRRAKGSYFIILDSDCILPVQYTNTVLKELNENYVNCFGGPDAAHTSFTAIQKAINFSMTSFITTGGIRGKKGSVEKFQPRSFNMGISKVAFEKSQGFGRIHPGEDPDLSLRLEKLGFETRLFPEAYVYHKRRISWSKFYKQVYKFGMVRPILSRWHKGTGKPTYWFPTLFILGLVLALILAITFQSYWLLFAYFLYFIVCFAVALMTTGSIKIAIMALVAVGIQFFGYGYGFLKSNVKLFFSGTNEPEQVFPELFFKKT